MRASGWAVSVFFGFALSAGYPSVSYGHEPAGSWIVFDTTNSRLPDNQVKSIAIDKYNNTWIGTRKGLARYDGSVWTVFDTANGLLPRITIRCLAIDSQNTKWIGTGAGVYTLSDTGWALYNSSNSDLHANSIYTLTVGQNQHVWAGLCSPGIIAYGAAEFDGRQWHEYSISTSGLPENTITAIGTELQNRIWFCSMWAGVTLLHDTTWTSFNDTNSCLPQREILSMAIDRYGTKWFGTLMKGLVRYSDSVWTVFDSAGGALPFNSIASIYIDAHNNKWLTAYTDMLDNTRGLAKLDSSNAVCTYYDTTNSGLPTSLVTCVAGDADTVKWIGTKKGLVRYAQSDTVVSVKNKAIANASILVRLYYAKGKLCYSVNHPSFVRLYFYDLKGRLIYSFIPAIRRAGIIPLPRTFASGAFLVKAFDTCSVYSLKAVTY